MPDFSRLVDFSRFWIFLRVLGISANQLKHRMTFLGGGAGLRKFWRKKYQTYFLFICCTVSELLKYLIFLAKHLIFISLPKGSEINVHFLTGWSRLDQFWLKISQELSQNPWMIFSQNCPMIFSQNCPMIFSQNSTMIFSQNSPMIFSQNSPMIFSWSSNSLGWKSSNSFGCNTSTSGNSFDWFIESNPKFQNGWRVSVVRVGILSTIFFVSQKVLLQNQSLTYVWTYLDL